MPNRPRKRPVDPNRLAFQIVGGDRRGSRSRTKSRKRTPQRSPWAVSEGSRAARLGRGEDDAGGAVSGGCPEDCQYCPQSVHYDIGLEPQALDSFEHVAAAARRAQAAGATRFCIGAAWRSPTDRDLTRVIEMVESVRDLGMETCVTLGMLSESQAQRLADAGLDYYNHNLDTSPEYYQQIITTRSYQDRLDTLGHVRSAGIKVCCGGIVGMGESRRCTAPKPSTRSSSYAPSQLPAS